MRTLNTTSTLKLVPYHQFFLSILFLPTLILGQSVVNGSINGTTVGNSMINPGNVPGWSNCGFSPDLTSNAFPSYVTTSAVASCVSPNGDPRLGVAALGECARTSMTGLTVGQTYYLCFYGACFGTGTSIFNGSPAVVQVCAEATCTTVSIPMAACTWNLYSLTFVATNTTMNLSVTAPTGNGYASLDGFYLSTNATCMTPLASRFSDFEATKHDNVTTSLSWKAVPSSTQDYFIIERFSEIDTVWKKIGTIQVDHIQTTSYKWIDQNPDLGKNYYQIHGYNGNGELVESTDIRMVQFDFVSSEVISIHPNPTLDVLSISVSDLKDKHVEILSSEGKIVYSGVLTDLNSTIDVSYLKKGVYLVRVGTKTGKMVKQ